MNTISAAGLSLLVVGLLLLWFGESDADYLNREKVKADAKLKKSYNGTRAERPRPVVLTTTYEEF